ncbi:Heat shock transcription factor, Y-linked [Microtus ochrogaster]|uniref:Heat shock transcription factor, Y-linked n=1 Tax=Microtus ochrogaster TaxID=79684 RepID=A0A8J6GE15_MICOH|nr:Heat shock transcription factor, Y-linked [Microtus ochrogaster]
MLWTIVQNDAFQSVNWGDDGKSIVIEVDLFQREIFNFRGTRKVFVVKRFKSFIRQLYRNGFRKIRPEDSVLDSGENRKTIVKYKVVLCLPLFVMRTSSYLHTSGMDVVY